MTAGHKIGRSGKGVPKQVKLDTPADTQTTTQVVKRQADDLRNNKGTKRQKGETALRRKVVKLKVPPREQNIFL